MLCYFITCKSHFYCHNFTFSLLFGNSSASNVFGMAFELRLLITYFYDIKVRDIENYSYEVVVPCKRKYSTISELTVTNSFLD